MPQNTAPQIYGTSSIPIDSVGQADLLVTLPACVTPQLVRRLAATTRIRPQLLLHHLEFSSYGDWCGRWSAEKYDVGTHRKRRSCATTRTCSTSTTPPDATTSLAQISARAARTFAAAFKFKKEP